MPWACNERTDNGDVEQLSFPEDRVQRDLADLRPHGGLRELGDGELRILDSVWGLQVQHSPVKINLHWAIANSASSIPYEACKHSTVLDSVKTQSRLIYTER